MKSHVLTINMILIQNIVSDRYMKISVALLLVSVFFSSCFKDSDQQEYSSVIVSAITVINASPDTPPLDFVLDNQRVQQFSYPDGKINYFAAFSGTRSARLFESGQPDQPLYTFDIRLLQGKYYSLFINGTKENLGALLIEDDLKSPGKEYAKVRFVNLSPDAPALDFGISGDSVLASQKRFKEYTGFQEVKAGNYSALIKSSNGDAINFPFDLQIKPGKIYTVWAKGLIESPAEGEEFGFSLLDHNID